MRKLNCVGVVIIAQGQQVKIGEAMGINLGNLMSQPTFFNHCT